MSNFPCPNCKAQMTFDPALAGQAVACPYCAAQFVMYGGQPTPSVPTQSISFSSVAAARFSKPSSFFDIFDFRFRMYLTPWIVRLTWIVVLALSVVALLGITLEFIAESIPESPKKETANSQPFEFQGERLRPTQPPPKVFWLKVFWRILSTVAQMIGVVASVLWTRVLLEIMIVIFNIAQSLASIDKKIKA
jgi:hypothetical protein